MSKNFKNNLIKKIKKENIKPISKTFFIIRKIFIYFFLGVSIIIGALSIAIIFGYLFEADWYISHKIGLIKITTTFLPIFWLLFLIFSSLLSYYNFKNTEKGYKFYLWQIILLNILISFIIGIFFYFTGFSQNIEKKIQNNLPKYRELLVGDKISRMKQIWQNEDSGLLLGRIIEKNNNYFTLKDTNNKIWNIKISNKTIIRHDLDLKDGLKIKLIGKKSGEGSFEVNEIRPFMGNGKGYEENHKKKK